jgi:replicative DNA helicase
MPPSTAHDHAEREFLGVVLRAPDESAQHAAGVVESDFRVDAHRRIWKAMTALWDSGRAADLVRVAAWLTRKGWLDDAGESVYLAELYDETPSGAGVDYYAAAVRENALRRRLADEGRRLAQLAEESGGTAGELLADVRARLEALTHAL